MQYYTSGNWHVTKGKEEEFVQRWTEFLEWTRKTQAALTRAHLMRDEQDPAHFVSVAESESASARDTWMQDEEFDGKFQACRDLCEDFYYSNYRESVTI